MIPLTPSTYVEDSGPDLGMADAAEAAYDLSSMDTFVGNMARNGALDEMEKSGAKILDPEELNKKYPNTGTPFKTPTNELVAFHLDEEGKKRKDLQAIIAKGAGDYDGAISMGAGIVAHMADPVEFGSGALLGLTVGGLGSLAAKGAFGARAVTAGQFASKGGFIKEAVEGIVGNLALEPYMMESADRANEGYTIQDAALNVVAGGLAFPGAIFGIKKALGGLKYASDSIYGTALKNSIGQFTEGFRPQLDQVKASYDKFIYSSPKDADVGSVRSSYSFAPVDVDTLKSRSMYAASRNAGTLEAGVKPIGDYHGDGVYLTDNPTVANNLAAHPMESELPAGDVFEMKLDKTNLADTSVEAPHILNALSDDLKAVIEGASTIKEAVDTINEKIDMGDLDDSAMVAFQDEIRDMGYDGYKFTDSDNGHNGAYIFPESANKLSNEGFYKSDSKSIAPLDKTEMRMAQEKMRAPENQLEFNGEAKKEWDEFSLQDDAKVIDIAKNEREADDFISTLDSMAKDELLSKESLASLESIKEQKSVRQSFLKSIQDLANCIIGVAE